MIEAFIAYALNLYWVISVTVW